MDRITQLFPKSIIHKVIFLVSLILISVGGILIVNIISFFNVNNSMVSMIDSDVKRVIANTKYKDNLNNSIALGDILIATFTERDRTFNEEKNSLIHKINNDISALIIEDRNSKNNFQEYMQNLHNLFDQCTIINENLKDIKSIEKSLDMELYLLDELVVEKELGTVLKDHEEAQSINQLTIMLPGYREIFFEIILEFINAKNTYLNLKKVKYNHEQKILSLLEEFDIGLSATPITWKDISPHIRNLMGLITRYKSQTMIVFKSMREFHNRMDILKLSQTQILGEIEKLNNQIINNTQTIRTKTSESTWSTVRTTVLLSSIIIFILFVIGIFTVRLVQPIKRLSIGAKKIGSGDLNYKVDIDSNDEIGNLAKSFNRMTDNLCATTVSKEYIENIIKSMNDMLIVLTQENNIQTINQATCDLLGYQANDLIGENVRKISGENDDYSDAKEKFHQKSKIEQLIQENFIKNIETTYVDKNGNKIPVLFSASAMFDKEENTIGYVCVASDISDIKRTAKALRDSEKKYKTLVEQSLQGITIFQDNRIVFANKAFAKISGYSEEELYSFSFDKIIALTHPEDQRLVWGPLNENLDDEMFPQRYEFRGIRKDGSERSLEKYANLISYNGRPAVQETVVDITQRKRAEEALKVSETNYRELFHAEPDAIIIVDAETHHIVNCNSSALTLYGYDYDEICGLHAMALSNEPEKSANHIQQILSEDPSSVTREIVQRLHKKKDGTVFPVEIASGFYIHDDRKMICAIMRDISKRKRAEDNLDAEKERLTVTLRSIGDGVISTDIHGKIISINKVAEELTGWRENEAIGRPLTEIFHIVDEFTRNRCEDPVRKVLKTGGIVGLANNTMLISKDGNEYIIADSGAPIFNNQHKIIGAVLVFRDITDKRKIEAELVKIQKLESLGVLAGGIAHDFNNFLTAIIGNISLAKLDSAPKDRILSRLDEMEKASLNAKNLTQQLLTFSKGGEPITKWLTIPKLVKDSAIFSLRGSNVRCNFAFAEDLRPVEVDEGQIGQVINNLVLNAAHAMPEGGIVGISVNNITLTTSNPFSLPVGAYLKLSFQDHGIGIHPDHLSKIFDPYFTTKHKGSGLGLTVAYSIIDKHNGRLTAESELGKQTTFTIYLPASEKLSIQTENIVKGLFAGGGKILVMDDEDFIREVASQMLYKIGYEVSVARDGNEAIEIYRQAQQSKKPFDAVILDLTVPGSMGGKEAIRKLKELDPNIKALVSSGYSNDPIMSNFRDYGFEGVVKKPYLIQDMSDALRSVISKIAE